MDLDEVEQLGVLMCGPRPTSVLHDDSGGRGWCEVCWGGVKVCRRRGENESKSGGEDGAYILLA